MPKLYAPIPGLEEAIAERTAQIAATEEAKPLVPGWLRALATAALPILAAAVGFLPHPISVYAGILGGVAALLAGVAMPQFNFAKPIIPLALVPVALSVSGYLGTLAVSVSSPLLQAGLSFAAFALAAVAGKALPTPKR
jgi:hypothetical protein